MLVTKENITKLCDKDLIKALKQHKIEAGPIVSKSVRRNYERRLKEAIEHKEKPHSANLLARRPTPIRKKITRSITIKQTKSKNVIDIGATMNLNSHNDDDDDDDGEINTTYNNVATTSKSSINFFKENDVNNSMMQNVLKLQQENKIYKQQIESLQNQIKLQSLMKLEFEQQQFKIGELEAKINHLKEWKLQQDEFQKQAIFQINRLNALNGVTQN